MFTGSDQKSHLSGPGCVKWAHPTQSPVFSICGVTGAEGETLRVPKWSPTNPEHHPRAPSTHLCIWGPLGKRTSQKYSKRNLAVPGTKVNPSISTQWSSLGSNPHPRTLLHLMRNISAKCSGHHLLSILLAHFPARKSSRPSLSCELTGGDKPGRTRILPACLIQPGWPAPR